MPVTWTSRKGTTAFVVLSTLLAVAIVAPRPAVAGLNNGLCHSNEARVQIPSDLALEACFDGRVLVLRNQTSIPVYVSLNGDHGSVQQGPTKDIDLAGPAFQALVGGPASRTVVPEYRMEIIVGTGSLEVSLSRTKHEPMWFLLSILLDNLPGGVADVKTVVELVQEWKRALDKAAGCADSGWIRRTACSAELARDLAFAIGRAGISLGVSLASIVFKAAWSIVTAGMWGRDSLIDAYSFDRDRKTLRIPAVPKPSINAPPPRVKKPPTLPASPPSSNGTDGGQPITEPPQPPTPTYSEQQGSKGSDTFRDPVSMGGYGPKLAPWQWVYVSCKVLTDRANSSAYPDGFMYKIESSPWNGEYFGVAQTFTNGDAPGTPREQWTNTDPAVPNC